MTTAVLKQKALTLAQEFEDRAKQDGGLPWHLEQAIIVHDLVKEIERLELDLRDRQIKSEKSYSEAK